MTRLHGLLTTVALAVTVAPGVFAQETSARVELVQPVVARNGAGSLHGMVSDEQGTPIADATVSAIGVTMVFATTDRRGRFAFDSLPAGRYLLRAHRGGFSPAARQIVDVRADNRVVKWLEMTPLSADRAEPVPRILAAGLGSDVQPVEVDAPPAIEPEKDDSRHPHTEAAWRLRHARRSVLKDESGAIVTGDEELAPSDTAAAFAPAFASPWFAALPFSTEINLLTTSALDGSGSFFTEGLPRGVTYVSLNSSPGGDSGWTVQAAVSHGDLSSWIVAGSFAARGPRTHAFDFGLNYGAQQYAGGNPAMLAVRSDGTRRAGSVYAFDNWAVTPRFHVSYGARLSRYDYASRDELWSPRLSFAFDLSSDTHVRATVDQDMRAPGAEEFLPASSAAGPWLPPEHTFSPLLGDDFRIERVRRVEVSVERQFEDAYVVAVRRFVETVDDQLVTIFGARTVSESRSDVGHYLVATAGGVDAAGWGVRVSSPSVKRLRGSLDYQLTRARWMPIDSPELTEVAPSAVRIDREDVHDIATSVEADITETDTRVFFYYRVSTAYARDEGTLPEPALGARFDLQVKQGLPFMPFRGSEWEVLVGIRDLFRDPLAASSVYDELLVVRPPKRVVGGVQVKF
jgi:hypothetical protein